MKSAASPVKGPAFALGLLLFIVVFHNDLSAKEKDQPSHIYTVVIPPEVPLAHLTIEYFLMDDFGAGMDGTLEHTGDDHRFVIPTDKTGKDAIGLEAVIFCPGYQTVTIYEPSLATSKRESIVTMQKLPMIQLAGQIANYKPVPVRDPVVNIVFSGRVGLPHWDILEGRNQIFKIARAPLLANGSFSVEIPDFFHDKGSPSGHLIFTVQAKDSNKTFLYLSNDRNEPNARFGNFKIQPTYDSMVTFYGYTGRPRQVESTSHSSKP